MKKPEINFCLSLIDKGISLLTTNKKKVPNTKWKKYQNEIISPEAFTKNYNLKTTTNVGIITGYNNLEVVDVDTKVFETQKEKDEFWDEYLLLLQSNIDDFNKKFVIVQTISGGFHILYKCKKIESNKKLASLENKRALIETRGVGGYVWVYDNFLLGKSYFDIVEISELDREILFSCAKTYDYINLEKEKSPGKKYEKKEHTGDGLTPWADYNQRINIFDLIKDEFSIVKQFADKTLIKRHGATSFHSGTIFHEKNVLYLFSTGTKYPHEKTLRPFDVFAIQNFGGDYKAAAKEIYRQGFGDRYEKKNDDSDYEPPEKKEIIFPIDIYPEMIQLYIKKVAKTLNASVDYLGCSMLWVLSMCIGNSAKIKIKNGWHEAGVVWLGIVGRAGIGKTHNIQAITGALTKINEMEIKRYNAELTAYNQFSDLTAKEKAQTDTLYPPTKKQFIVGDITIESLFDYHSENMNGIGILRDELAGWIKDLNKYRTGSDLETYLSCWSNGQIILNRKTAKSAYVPKAYVPILGGIQPNILSGFFTEENKENGFMDRVLLCYPDLDVDYFNEDEIHEEALEWYEKYISNMFWAFKNNINYDEFGNIKPDICTFDSEAKKQWIRVFNKITDMQNSDDHNEYMKSILPKQKSYVARFALLLNALHQYDVNGNFLNITADSVLKAEKLSDYFIAMAEKNKIEKIENNEIAEIINRNKNLPKKEIYNILQTTIPDLNKSKVAELLCISRMTLHRWAKN